MSPKAPYLSLSYPRRLKGSDSLESSSCCRSIGAGRMEVEGAETPVRLCVNDEHKVHQLIRVCVRPLVSLLPCNKTMGFLRATACLISIWQ